MPADTLQGGSQRTKYADIPLLHSLYWLNITRRWREEKSSLESILSSQLSRVPAGWERLGSASVVRETERTGFRQRARVPRPPSSPSSVLMS